MLPVSAQLPRNGRDADVVSVTASETPDPVLDLLLPLISSSEAGPPRWTALQVREVREKLEKSVKDNKARGHEVLLANFASVSSHIRQSSELQKSLGDISSSLSSLERQIDPSDPQSSFLPPTIDLLQRHFAAVEQKSRAQAHLAALRVLASQTELIERLESAVWAGRGADDWVVAELELANRYEKEEGIEIVQGTKAMLAFQQRLALLRSMVVEQLTDGYAKAISFAVPTDGRHGTTLTVQTRISLQQPRIPRSHLPESGSTASDPSFYPLEHTYSVLHRLGSLQPLLQNLRNRILRSILWHLVEGEKRWRLEQGSADNLTVLRLTSCDPRRPAEVLSDTSTLLQFAANTVFPSSTPPIPERESFLSELRHATNTAVLDFVLLPSMPSSVPSVPGWLDLLLQAVDSEASLPGVSGNEVIKPFFESEAGSAWASQRRRSVAEEVRKLITGAWGGWEAVEAEREKEITVVVEVEVEEDNLGWGFEDKTKPPKTKPVEPEPAAKTSDAGEMQVDEDEGWGFEYGANAGLSSSHQESAMNGDAAGPSEDAETEGDGWDFEISEPTAPEPVPVARPAREAKRLGRKLAKAKTAEPVEEEGWKSESSMKSGMVAEVTAAEENAGRNSRAAADSWGDWTEDVPRAAATNTSPVKLKRTVLKEEKRVIKEHFLVSQACDKLLEFAVRMLQEAQDLHNTSLPSSFASTEGIMIASVTDVFDVYRALMPTFYASQLRDVPTLAMQFANDCSHLAERVEKLCETGAWDGANTSRRLREAGEQAFETQLQVQLESLMSILDDAAGFVETGTDVGYRRCEKVVKQVEHNIESLTRALKAVLPMTTYLSALGYLLDCAVQRISSDILALPDITEVESNRLNELVKLLHPLEQVFVSEPDQPSSIVAQVPHWLKFCYISELLVASLVDITYLFDTGALVDFTTEELVNVIKALFADSPKRDAAIERIEKGVPQGAAEEA